jgi:hypothetical protein
MHNLIGRHDGRSLLIVIVAVIGMVSAATGII